MRIQISTFDLTHLLFLLYIICSVFFASPGHVTRSSYDVHTHIKLARKERNDESQIACGGELPHVPASHCDMKKLVSNSKNHSIEFGSCLYSIGILSNTSR